MYVGYLKKEKLISCYWVVSHQCGLQNVDQFVFDFYSNGKGRVLVWTREVELKCHEAICLRSLLWNAGAGQNATSYIHVFTGEEVSS